jgi:HAD superfamily phosphoserine phosphatase-like hydrolase
MRVFDFDNTLYDGETMVDFFHFMVEKKEELKKYKSLVNFFLNLYNHNMLPMNLVRKCIDKYKGELNYSTKNLDKYVDEFWELHRDKIMKDMVKKVKKDDVIITASLDFLLRPIMKELPTKNIICTEVDIENKKVDCVCYKENKVKKYREKYKDRPIDELYTDSYTDKPLMQISKKVYLIDKKTKEIKVIKDEK